MKKFYTQSGLARSKYYVFFHDGIKRHNDGSEFFDMRSFNNKKVLNKFISELRTEGYVNKDWVELG